MARRFARTPDQYDHDTIFHLALERLARTFEPKEGLEPFRLPAEPFALSAVIAVFYDEDADVDARGLWYETTHDSVLRFSWDSGGPGGSSWWDLDAVTLPSKRRVYVVTADEDDGPDIIAATGPILNDDDADLRLVELLTANGTDFGVWLPNE